MAATIALGCRVDKQIKAEFDETAEAIGITPAAALTVFMKRFADDGGFPFEVKRHVPTKAEYEAEMSRRLAEMEAGHYTVHELVEV